MYSFSSVEQYHIPMVLRWFDEHKVHNRALEVLSNTGIMCYKGGMPVAAVWLIYTNSIYCLFEGLVVESDLSSRERAKAISALIDYAVSYADSLGYKAQICMVDQGMKRRLTPRGFRSLENVVPMLRSTLRIH